MAFPFIDIEPVSEQSTETFQDFREFEWDYATNQYVIRDGQINTIEGKEALKIWIYKCIMTVRGRYDAYTWDFGTDLESLINSGLNREIIKSETKRLIREALLINEYIIDCYNFSIDFKGDTMYVEFTVDTVYGDIEIGGSY